MYGHIHVILKDLVLTVAGESAWLAILQEAGFYTPQSEANALDTVVHDDTVTLSLVGATCKVLELSPETALRTFGRHFVGFALRSGNAAFLKSQGVTLHAFLENVNNLHSYLERDHPNAKFPFIEARYDPVQDCVELTYLSVREGLKTLLEGVVEEVGKRLYGLIVDFQEVEVPEDLAEAAKSGRAAAWRVTWRPRPGGVEAADEEEKQARKAPRMPFPTLHNAMTEFMRLVRQTDTWSFGCACGPRKPNVAEPTMVSEASTAIVTATPSYASSDDEDDDEELMVRKSSSAKKLSEVNMRGNQPLESVLLRATPANKVAAAWSDVNLPQCRAFWQDSNGRAEDYDLSQDARRVDVFVSHSWSPPENWKIVMGTEINYADLKSTILAVMAKDIALMREKLESWGHVTLWVDKACIPQDNKMLKESCINLIEKFIRRCDHVCVLFTWSYLERLWCVFEWACVLLDKSPERLWLQTENFVTEQSLPLYLECIRYFSLKRTKCYLEADRKILERKIDLCYVSREAFEELVKAHAVALMARSMAYRAGRSTTLQKRFYQPWVDLAVELGFEELAAALATCRALEWREAAAGEPSPGGGGEQPAPVLLGRANSVMGVSASKYHGRISQWFSEAVAPVLERIRKRLVCE